MSIYIVSKLPPGVATTTDYGNIGYVDVPDSDPGGGGTPISLVANDNLTAFDPVIITGHLADSSSSGHLGKVVGLAATTTLIGFAFDLVTDALAQNGSWSWTPGGTIFLNGTTLSQTPPSTGFIQVMGVAKASDTVYIDLTAPIKL